MSGSSPVGRNSLVTETKIAPARTRSPIQGKGLVAVGADCVISASVVRAAATLAS